jgi:pimeloyl-ACP methyl ester carboxylesterase
MIQRLFSEQVRKQLWIQLIISLVLASIPINTMWAKNIPFTQTIASSNTVLEDCQDIAQTEWWNLHINWTYQRAITFRSEEISTDQVADLNLTLGMPERSDTEVVWSVTQSSGTGKIVDDDIILDPDSNWFYKTRGQGSAGAIGEIRLDLTTCTYDLDIFGWLDQASITSPEGVEHVKFQSIGDLFVKDRPIMVSNARSLFGSDQSASTVSTPKFEWSGSVPAVRTSKTNDQFEGGASGNSLIEIAKLEGQPNAGYAIVSWSSSPMGITKLVFEQQQVPNKNWVEVPDEGTVDGNLVKITATINNPTHNAILGPVRFIDAETGELLPDGEIDTSIPANQQREISYEWDTQGWAWEDGRGAGAHSQRKIRVEIGPEDEIYDLIEQGIIVRPKPVVLVHGLNSNASTWAAYPAMLKAVNPYWKAFPIDSMRTGDDIVLQQESNTILGNATALHKYIEQVRAQEQAWQVDIVAHSMGGLISRQYIHSFMQTAPTLNARPLVRNLVMLGTPNQGSICALSLTAMNLQLRSDNLAAPIELLPHVVQSFNQKVTEQRGVHFSVIAGDSFILPCVPPGFGLFDDSDLVVTVQSAHHIYSDIGLTNKSHMAMTSDKGIFDLWVLPRLALGKNITQARLANVKPAASEQSEQLSSMHFNKLAKLDLQPNQSLDIPFDIAKASALQVMILAAGDVSTSLIDPSGKVVDAVAAKSERAVQPFRALQATAPAAGSWKLRLHNQLAQSTSLAYGLTLLGGDLEAQGTLERDGSKMQLQFSINKQQKPQAAAKVSAELIANDGTRTSVTLYDDGQHGDGAAGDGVFAASVAVAADKQYVAMYTAQLGQETLVCIATAATSAQAQGAVVYLPFVSYNE